MVRLYGADTTEKMLMEHVKECGEEAMKLMDMIIEIFNGKRQMIKTLKEIFENIERKEYNSSGKKEFLLDVISSLIIDEFLKLYIDKIISYTQYETLDSRHIFVEELVEYLCSYEKNHHKIMIFVLLVFLCAESNLFPSQAAYFIKNILKENQDDKYWNIFYNVIVIGVFSLLTYINCEDGIFLLEIFGTGLMVMSLKIIKNYKFFLVNNVFLMYLFSKHNEWMEIVFNKQVIGRILQILKDMNENIDYYENMLVYILHVLNIVLEIKKLRDMIMRNEEAVIICEIFLVLIKKGGYKLYFFLSNIPSFFF
jgi:hypothetical protein